MNPVAARAAKLAKRATRYSKDRNEFRRDPQAIASRVLTLIERISKLNDAYAGEAKQDALNEAWEAYARVQGYLDHHAVEDTAWASMVDCVGDAEDVLGESDIDGYALSRVNAQFAESDQAYQGWVGDYADWN